MPAKLKDLFDAALVRRLAADLRRAHPGLDARAFTRDCLAGLDALELTGRAGHIADVMHRHLPQPFAAGARVLMASLGPVLESTEEFGLALFAYLPHVFFVAKYGLDDFETAMAAQYELTQRFSAEYSIRGFLVRYPTKTYERLVTWASDPSPHVRRLVSEGTRPRLPWAPRLRAYQQDPAPVVALLERLKDDPERYVQRSVANSLNDISKDHPALVVEVCRRWLMPPVSSPAPAVGSARAWIVRHALRTLIKRGDPATLALFGVGDPGKVAIRRIVFERKRVRIGEVLRFSFELASTQATSQRLLIDYAVHFVKASGGSTAKVFKLRTCELPGKAVIVLGGEISFKPMTTRRHHPGRHRIEALINGVAHPLGVVTVQA
jgi:3-methyladenine DNA glycosylase AlkC